MHNITHGTLGAVLKQSIVLAIIQGSQMRIMITMQMSIV
jgi:hypothetical protein